MSISSNYNELRIAPTSHKQEFLDFLFSLGVEAIEEENETLIVRSENDLSLIKWGAEEFAKKIEDTFKKKINLKSSLEIKANQNWIKQYQESINPIEVGSFYIYPSWKNKHEKLINIQIDPSLTFGSGHHESTYSCIKALEKYVKKGMHLLDVGCGSGILSIIASKLGAIVQACDTDELAVISTKKNAKLNHIKLFDVWEGSIDKNIKTKDIIVANIIADILIAISKDLKRSLKKGGILILSGILDKYENRIMDNFKEYCHVETISKNEWRTIIFKKV